MNSTYLLSAGRCKAGPSGGGPWDSLRSLNPTLKSFSLPFGIKFSTGSFGPNSKLENKYFKTLSLHQNIQLV